MSIPSRADESRSTPSGDRPWRPLNFCLSSQEAQYVYSPCTPLLSNHRFCGEPCQRPDRRARPSGARFGYLVVKALTAGVAVNDVILQASVAYVAGSDQESGTATLTVSGNQQSLVQLNLTGGPRQEIRNGPAGAWSGPDGTLHSTATHNCWPDADWFYPGLSFQALSSDTGLGLSYVGPETKNGLAVVHLIVFRVVPGQSAAMTAEITGLSAEDVYLDPVSFLPLFLDLKVHPEQDFGVNIPVEVAFSGYQPLQGIVVPTHIQKYLNGSLLLDLSITSATINSALPPSTFAVPSTSGGAQ